MLDSLSVTRANVLRLRAQLSSEEADRVLLTSAVPGAEVSSAAATGVGARAGTAAATQAGGVATAAHAPASSNLGGTVPPRLALPPAGDVTSPGGRGAVVTSPGSGAGPSGGGLTGRYTAARIEAADAALIAVLRGVEWEEGWEGERGNTQERNRSNEMERGGEGRKRDSRSVDAVTEREAGEADAGKDASQSRKSEIKEDVMATEGATFSPQRRGREEDCQAGDERKGGQVHSKMGGKGEGDSRRADGLDRGRVNHPMPSTDRPLPSDRDRTARCGRQRRWLSRAELRERARGQVADLGLLDHAIKRLSRLRTQLPGGKGLHGDGTALPGDGERNDAGPTHGGALEGGGVSEGLGEGEVMAFRRWLPRGGVATGARPVVQYR